MGTIMGSMGADNLKGTDLEEGDMILLLNGADIADALIAECAASAGCKRTVSFDKSAAKAGMAVLR